MVIDPFSHRITKICLQKGNLSSKQSVVRCVDAMPCLEKTEAIEEISFIRIYYVCLMLSTHIAVGQVQREGIINIQTI